ncbi:hypothetical protein TGAM01_v205158 [Trichoderma gamsii]|uniref:Uncharacterized protein n=1 Tax=Trichoderma gamsii TaxID=398673 RepID=A0A2P4ZPL9_9HYPO|nr:hypothetical protein TGAM01_v205158 [Trichoderma gamsii]PON26214.1 hypothetical protein TGAM01_v205158 [Trichoderma gamsii]
MDATLPRPTRPNAETRNANVSVDVGFDVGFDDANRPRASEKRGPSAPGSAAARGPATLVPGDAQSIQGRFRLSAIKHHRPTSQLQQACLKYAEGSSSRRQIGETASGQVHGVPVLWAGMLGRQLKHMELFSVATCSHASLSLPLTLVLFAFPFLIYRTGQCYLVPE